MYNGTWPWVERLRHCKTFLGRAKIITCDDCSEGLGKAEEGMGDAQQLLVCEVNDSGRATVSKQRA